MNNNINIKLVISYLTKYKLLVFIAVCVMLAVTLFEGIGIGMIVPILEEISSSRADNVFSAYVKNTFSFFGINYSFINLMVIFGLLMLLKYILLAMQKYFARLLYSQVTYDLRMKAFRNLMDVPLSYYYDVKVGDIIATVFTSANYAGGLMEYLVLFFTESMLCLIYIVLSFMVSVPLTLTIIIVTGLLYFFISPRFKKAHAFGNEEKKLTDEIASYIHDKIGGIKVLKAFNNEKLHTSEFDRIARAYKKFLIKLQKNRVAAELLIEPPILVFIIALLVFSVKALNLSIIPLLTLLYIFRLLMPRIRTVNSNFLYVKQLLPHFSKIQEIIDRNDKRYVKSGTRAINKLVTGIEFKNVWFRYPGKNVYVLKDINLSVESKRTLAIIGGSGGGKTTFVDLIMRHHDPEKGRILIDGADLKDLDTRDWHSMVGVVDQENYLYHDSIFNNILYGDLSASGDKVIEAAKTANAHDFISSLPDGYHTVVGERGIILSGGQKQRIALARALLRDPEILILDEATSSLDSESEKLIQEAIVRLKKTRTILLIAHRLSTTSFADKVIVIDKGLCLEQGSPEELLKKEGVYKKYHLMQSGKGAWFKRE